MIKFIKNGIKQFKEYRRKRAIIAEMDINDYLLLVWKNSKRTGWGSGFATMVISELEDRHLKLYNELHKNDPLKPVREEVMEYHDMGTPIEVAYYGNDGRMVGYWAYGCFDPYRGIDLYRNSIENYTETEINN